MHISRGKKSIGSKPVYLSNLELLGEQFMQRVNKALRKESWGKTILQLAWTAGPVTYLALQGGYMLGFGKQAPPNLILYFGIYTIIAGLVAVLVRFVYHLTRGQDIEEAQQALTHALNTLPDLILLARNQSLLEYDEENRKFLGAKYLLENPDAMAETVKTAVENVTGDEKLATAAARIEIFRKNGLFAPIEDIWEEIEKNYHRTIEEVREKSPAVALILERRLKGDAPRKRSGRSRTEGFIQRVLTAGEEHNFDLMSLNDAEEMYTLAYELLADRSIPILALKYIGSREFSEVSNQIDSARMAFRKAAYIRNSRLRRLAELFSESDQVVVVPAATPVLTTLDSMYRNVTAAMESFYKEVKRRVDLQQRRRRRADQDLEEDLIKLKTAVELYRSLRQASIITEKHYRAFQRAQERYEHVLTNKAKHFTLKLLREKERGKGIRIVERRLALSQKSKLRLSRQLHSIIGQVETNDVGHTAVFKPHTTAEKVFEVEDYKKVAFDIAMALEKEIGLGRFDIQYAIESSNAPYLSALEVGLTTATKTGWAVSLVKEVQENKQKAIHRLSQVLVNYHGVPLDEQDIDYLAATYGADRVLLAWMNPEDTPTNYSLPYLNPPQLLSVKPLDPKYQRLLDHAYKLR
jgi:hypothetical protein